MTFTLYVVWTSLDKSALILTYPVYGIDIIRQRSRNPDISWDRIHFEIIQSFVYTNQFIADLLEGLQGKIYYTH